MATQNNFIPPHGGYQKLASYQMAEIVYDATVFFCNKYTGKRSRTHDQMVQAARSGKQNIAEGSMVYGVSKETEIKLRNVVPDPILVKRFCINFFTSVTLTTMSYMNNLSRVLLTEK